MSEYERGYQAFIEAGYSHMTGDQAVRGIDREPTKLLESLAQQMSQDTTQESEVISQAGSTSVRIAVIAIILAIVVSAVVASLFMNRKWMGDAIDKLQGTQHWSHDVSGLAFFSWAVMSITTNKMVSWRCCNTAPYYCFHAFASDFAIIPIKLTIKPYQTTTYPST